MIERAITVVIPTFNNVDVLRTCIDGWRQHGGPREIVCAGMRQVTKGRTA
jgi:GT2 family glycosyltransferase